MNEFPEACYGTIASSREEGIKWFRDRDNNGELYAVSDYEFRDASAVTPGTRHVYLPKETWERING